MKKTEFMIYKEVIEKRLKRKKQELSELETAMGAAMGDSTTAVEKRKFIELKAVVTELENLIDIGESLSETEEIK